MKRLAVFLGLLALLAVIPMGQAAVTSIASNIVVAGEIPGTLEVTVDVKPDSLTSNTRGKYVTCYVTPSEGYTAFDIDVSTVYLEGVPVLPECVGIIDHDLDGIKELMVKFDRPTVLALFEGINGDVALTLTGSYTDGVTFFGIDSVHVVWH